MKKKFLGNLLLLTASIAATLVIAELFLSYFKPAPKVQPIDITSDYGGHLGNYTLSENKTLIYIPTPNTGDFNSMGYRGKEFDFKRTPGKKRIIFLGDSVLEGLGVEADERYTDYLSKKLGAVYELINLGVQGYNLQQEIEYFKEFGIKYRPDTVIFCTTFNDLEIHSGQVTLFSKKISKIKTNILYSLYYKKKNMLEKKLLNLNSYRYAYIVCNYIKRSTSNKAREGDFSESIYYRLTEEEADEIINGFSGYASANDFRVIFIFMPVNTETGQMELIKDVVEKHGIGYIDLNDELQGDKELLFLNNDICHLNKEGHAIVADAIYENRARLLGTD